jgi:hypothetical protein
MSLDQARLEDRYTLEPADALTPERLYEKAWLAALLEAAGRQLHDEYASAGKEEIYEHLKDCRLDAPDQPAYVEVARRLGQSEAAVKSAIWRLRRRHQALVREEVAHTLGARGDIDAEIRYLLEVARAR